MQNQALFNKYNTNNRHWDNHSSQGADTFGDFLLQNKFKGLILDAGCGSGRDTNLLASKGFDVLGIDNSEEEVRNAKENYPDLKFEVRNVENLDLKDESVGAIFCINTIHYVDEIKAVSEFIRLLKNGGYLYIHFNLEIKDVDGQIDYKREESEVLDLFHNFEILNKNHFSRTDREPVEHTHLILELILRLK